MGIRIIAAIRYFVPWPNSTRHEAKCWCANSEWLIYYYTSYSKWRWLAIVKSLMQVVMYGLPRIKRNYI